MRKKTILFTMAAMLVLSVGGCGKKETANTTENTTANTVTETNTGSADTSSEASAASYELDSEYYIFSVLDEYQLESDAWLGVIPTGTLYEKEVDADDQDMIYTYCENLEKAAGEAYIFKFEKEYFDSIGDGTFDMVLCSSDNGEVGKVLLQYGIEKKGSDVSLDFVNEK